MARTVSIDDLADAIAEELSKYDQEVADGVKAAVIDVAKVTRKEVKKAAPKLTGDYSKSWNAKKIFENREVVRVVVHSKDEYPLTHLLEHGFKHTSGKKINAQPHIRQAERKAEEILMKKVEVVVRGENS